MRALRILAALVACFVLAGCHTDMWTQKKLKPQQESTFFSDMFGSRPRVDGTVARGLAKLDDAYWTGMVNGKLIDYIPMKVTKEVLYRGEERFNVVCANCHGRMGDGQGMIAMRGFSEKRPPQSFHNDRLRRMPVGHFYDVITNGYGVMYRQSPRVAQEDRWAIVAYIRALQLAFNARTTDVPASEMAKLEGTNP